MSDESQRRRAKKARLAGCSNCKRRKVKCDEQLPGCKRCAKIGVECPGYHKPVKWSVKYERHMLNSSRTAGDSFHWFEAGAKNPSNSMQLKSGHGSGETQNDNDSEVQAPRPSTQGSSSSFSTAREHVEDMFEMKPTSASNSDQLSTLCDDVQVDEEYPLAVDALHDESFCLTSYTPTPQTSLILDHYFTTVCHFNSSFDSVNNPFRSEVARMMADSPLLLGCVLSMSAAHLYQGDKSSSCIPLEFQTEAMSQLSHTLSELPMGEECEVDDNWPTALVYQEKVLNVSDDLLLSIIFLGMTAAWHDVSATGLPHLHGSRQLFKSWITLNKLADIEKRRQMTRAQTFVVSSMVYWEAMSSALFDQQYEGLSHLTMFCDPYPPALIQPCPWTGVATPIFVFLAKTLTLVRNNQALKSLRTFESGESHRKALYAELLVKATSLEREIVGYRLPFVGLIDNIGDPCTTPDHLLDISRCYRLAALLELYSAFPEIIRREERLDGAFDLDHDDDKTYLVTALAYSILEILEKIPDDSGTISIQLLSLLISGSVLGPVSLRRENEGPKRLEILRLRTFVRQRIHKMYAAVRLGPIENAMLVMEEVWARMDILPAIQNANSAISSFHWINVMSEKRLETMFG
ncbi:Arginine metabolism regulation II [Fusarium pseudocircinatum]|uniref:Arginine metabolism regulation II n=1 Tax=Fusarium pseudocircinatum TaxID=56676 RepID=A0A8H5NTC2_9HYPO|nr:Arginine metabolism regulation II [Fusarium pseudocircinatum]